MPGWVPIAEGAAAVLAVALGLYKVMRVVFRVDAALPTLLGIADEFKPNGGNSLKDHLARLNGTVTELTAVVNDHTAMDEKRFNALDDLVKSSTETLKTQATTIDDSRR